MRDKLLEAIHGRLAASSALSAIVGNRIAYSRAPVSSTYPQLIYFDVTDRQGYLIDFDSMQVQFSVWSTSAPQALRAAEIVRGMMTRISSRLAITGGYMEVNWSELIESGPLPQEDVQLYGQFIRVQFNYRGTNLGG